MNKFNEALLKLTKVTISESLDEIATAFSKEFGESININETGWLIEHENEPKWLTLKPGDAAYKVCWTKDSLDALRFARREDVDDYVKAFLEDVPIRITEHRWDS